MNRLELTEHPRGSVGVLNSDQIGQNGANSSLIKPILPEVVWDLPNEERTQELVNITLNFIFRKLDRENRDFWLKKFEHYNNLPKVRSKERKIANGFLTEIAEGILQNPQELNFMQEALIDKKNNALAQDPKQQFIHLVKDNCLTLIKDEWEGVKPKQLAKLVSIYANDNDPSQDFAKDLLKNYFKGPRSRKQRIDAYYKLAYSTLHLIEDDKAFTQAIKIALHDTDILPKDPNLIEQTVFLSLPYNEEEIVFQKLLIAKIVMFQLSFLSLEDLEEVRQAHYDFLSVNEKITKKWNEKERQAIKQIGRDKVRKLNSAMLEFNDVRPEDALSEEEKLKLKNIWPYNLLFDETDPLNQKFQKVLSQNDKFLNRSKKPEK